ncbi:MAG: hypothetical protein V2J26_04940 [Pacificimonas sp.]|jgi:hypothetical protein|nr:hypothetical protein [Pacificimonas sp.]
MSVTAITLGARLLGLGSELKDGAKAVLGWIFYRWERTALVAACIAILFLRAGLAEWRDLAHAETARADSVQSAFDRTVANVRRAAAQAKADAEANVQRVKNEQILVTERIVHDFETDLAAVRARAERLRRQLAARADRGGADPAGLSGVPAAAGGADDAPGGHRLPAAGNRSHETGILDLGTLPLHAATPSEWADGWGGGWGLEARLTATEQSLQLDHLIDWLCAQLAIPLSPAADPVTLPKECTDDR